jgi:RES domain-containing protein
LEIIVNVDDWQDLYRIPYALVPVDFDESLVSRVDTLPADWKEDPPPLSTATIGDEWFRSRRSALLEVPSAVIPVEHNFILNPLHKAFAEIKIGEPQKFEFDARLVILHRPQISQDL